MAVDMFLSLDGIKGESKDHKHKDTIDVLAWSWGISNAGTFGQGSGGGSGKANFQDISFTKYIDKATASLMFACSSGKHIKKGFLTVRKAGEKPLEYIKLELENILVSSISTGGSGGEERLTENVTLNFGIVKLAYKTQDDTGKQADGGDYAWNITENTKL